MTRNGSFGNWPNESLTKRELEVLALLAQGRSNRQIAEELVIAVNTVKRYVYDISQKLDASNRTHAVARARELGLLAQGQAIDHTRHSLPTFPTPFVGRADEIAELNQLLDDPDCRLLTLVGPGGIGKTRLAQEAARLQQDTFADGVYFVPLQPLRSPDFIVSAIANLFDFSFLSAENLTHHLLNFLHEKRMLLILDNFEHLVDGADLLTEILASAPGVKLLVTSRERLNLREEWVFDVAGLAFPDNGDMTALEDYSACQLFVHSAGRAGYTPIAADSAAITHICQLVDGIPLAIELAAAWVRVLPCAEIAGELARCQDILTTATRNMPAKHRSMRAVFEYSWNLLSEDEQRVFEKLAVFVGGFRREAADQVVGASLTMLESLIDKSLLQRDATGRYSLQQLLRQNAEEQLQASGAMEATHDAHAAYYAGLLDRLGADLKGPDQIRALDEIEADIDNVRASWRWAVMQGRAHEIAQLLDSLGRFYEMRGHFQEAQETFALAVERIGAEETQLLGQLLLWYAWFLYTPRRFDCLQRGMSILEPAGDYHTVLIPMGLLGIPAFCDRLGGNGAIRQFYQNQLAAARKRHDDWAAARMLFCLGCLTMQAEKLPEAQSFLQESLAGFRALGDEWSSAKSISILGEVAQQRRHFQEALYLYRDQLTLCKNVGDIAGMAFALSQMGIVLEAMGEPETLRRYLGDALKLSLEVRFEWVNWIVLLWAAEHLKAARGKASQTVEVFAGLRKHFGHWQGKRELIERHLAALQAELPPDEFAVAVRKGESRSLEALADALIEQILAPDKQASSASSQPLLDPLTEREQDVLRLMADGLNNPQIAEHLVVAVGTVKAHTNRIFGKLHVNNRVQAVNRAKELHLV